MVLFRLQEKQLSSHTFRFLGQISSKNPQIWAISDSNEIKHITKVLRLSEGTEIEVTDGKGRWIKGLLGHANKSEIPVQPTSSHQEPANHVKLSIAIGALKHGHIDEIVPPLCELGVNEFHIFLQQNEKTLINSKAHDRWKRLAESAIKQSKRSWLPNIEVHSDLDSLLKKKNLPKEHCYYLDAAAERSLLTVTPLPPELLVVIGGEKGLMSGELLQLKSHSFTALSMSTGVLRAKTAAIASASILGLQITNT